MPVINRFADLHDDIAAWRRHIHEYPELAYTETRTAALVADKLAEFGVDEITTGIGETGVVGVIKGRQNGSGRIIGLRADMDALPIEEETGKDYASTTPGLMHACGHDGHTAMLLGAARYLCETRNFDGTVVVVFQPAEEGGAGAKAMIEDGLMERFGIQEVYGMHNMPGLEIGHFAIRPGGLMASIDRFTIHVDGRGGHGAWPQNCIDPILAASHIVTGIQSIVSRNVDPRQAAVISITIFQAGEADNVIPPSAFLQGTVRTLDPQTRDLIELRMREFVEATARSHGATARLDFERDYPVTVNHAQQTRFAGDVAERVAGAGKVDRDVLPTMGGEDFSFMLEEKPGAFIFMGNGDSAGLHHPAYDFNDEAIPYGCSFWVSLVEEAMPVR